jgi:hypothetical protein
MLTMDHTLPSAEEGTIEKITGRGGVYDPAKLEAAYKTGELTDMNLRIIAINQNNVQLMGLASIDHGLDEIRVTAKVLRVGVFIIAGIAVIDAVIRWGTV